MVDKIYLHVCMYIIHACLLKEFVNAYDQCGLGALQAPTGIITAAAFGNRHHLLLLLLLSLQLLLLFIVVTVCYAIYVIVLV